MNQQQSACTGEGTDSRKLAWARRFCALRLSDFDDGPGCDRGGMSNIRRNGLDVVLTMWLF